MEDSHSHCRDGQGRGPREKEVERLRRGPGERVGGTGSEGGQNMGPRVGRAQAHEVTLPGEELGCCECDAWVQTGGAAVTRCRVCS